MASTHQPRTAYDVVVVGARCAGAATARLLAARGLDVLLLERGMLPSDTLSTHGLARGGVVQLSRWGLLDDVLASGAPAVREVVFGVEGDETRRPIKPAAGVDCLVAPRRTHLDALLAASAVAAGAELRTRTEVTGVVRDDAGRVCGVHTRPRDGEDVVVGARLVIGADGLRSSMAGWVGARTQRSFAAASSTFYTYVERVDWSAFEFHVAPGAFAGVFPTHDGAACVFLCRPTSLLDPVRGAGRARGEALLTQLDTLAPGLAARCRAGRVGAPVRASIEPPNYLREAVGDGWALVGDAGYHRDPITGHGITDAFRDAELLADAAVEHLRDGSPLTSYQEARDLASHDVFDLTRELLRYPHPTRFVALQRELAEALDREADQLAARPVPTGTRTALAV